MQDESSFTKQNSFSIADNISTLIDECINYGTIPFSIIARHGFISESILRSLVNNKTISIERITEFKTSFKTISGEMNEDFEKVINSKISKENYLNKYGHLRPSSYDILSPIYSKRDDLFDGLKRKSSFKHNDFKLTKKEFDDIQILLHEHGFDSIDAQDLFNYAEKSIKGREYAKFIFTKHLSKILESVSDWGDYEGFSRKQMSMLTINDVLNSLISPLSDDVKSFYLNKINKAQNNFEISRSFKLSYLIRSTRDIHIVPMQRSSPNFIGNKRIESAKSKG